MTPKVEAEVVQAKSWFLLHERLIITILLIALAAGLGYKILGYQAEKDRQAATLAQQALTAQQDENKQLAQQASQQTQQTQMLIAQLTAQNAQLAQGIQSRTVVLQTQQKAIQTLPLPDLAKRWAQLANVQPEDMTATTDGIMVSTPAARATVSQLEELPVVKANLADTEKQRDNLTAELRSSTDLNTVLSTQVTGLQNEVAYQTTAYKTEVTALKAEARKGKLKTFGIGYAAGFVSGLVVRFF